MKLGKDIYKLGLTILVISVAIFSSSCGNDQVVGSIPSHENDSTLAKEAIDLFYNKKYEESLKVLENLIIDNPNVADLYFWKAKNFGAFDSLKMAIRFYSDAIIRDSSQAKYYSNRGLLYGLVDEEEKEAQDYAKAIEVDSTFYPAFINIANYYLRKDDYANALAFATYAINYKSDVAEFYYTRGVTYINLGDMEMARRDLNRSVQLNPDFTVAILYRGVARYKLGQKSFACDDFNLAYSRGSADAGEYLKHCP